MSTLRLGMTQINTIVGDLEGNVARIKQYIDEARTLEVDLLSFPELVITGYPPEDLLLKPQFTRDNLKQLQELVTYSRDITTIVGFVDVKKNDLYNAAAVIHDGKLVDIYHKMILPNYGVFDEERYFKAGTDCPIFVINGVLVGVNICEDMWYPTGPTAFQTNAGAELIVNISSSPYHAGKRDFREKMLITRASDNTVIIAYTNLVGGQDELIFDGGSMVVDEKGNVVCRGKQFEEDLVVADINTEGIASSRLRNPKRRKGKIVSQIESVHIPRVVVSEKTPSSHKISLPSRDIPRYNLVEEVYAALVLGTRDYVRKNGFQKVVVGLSGGIDSSLVAAIAVDALGSDNVIGVAMPSQYTSLASKSDAQLLANNLGIKFKTIPIEDTFHSYLEMLSDSFHGLEPDITEENIQARIRGNILMALSNKFGWLVLTTGNKSEMATGYCTLYGDMAGGFAPIKDVPKTLVYQLARHRNSIAGKDVIPQRVINKEPSAELRLNQRDTDSLPPYEVLDPILQAYVEEDKSIRQIVDMGFNEQVVRRVVSMVDRNEYKRRQAPPGIKITPRAFGKDRRLPITCRYENM